MVQHMSRGAFCVLSHCRVEPGTVTVPTVVTCSTLARPFGATPYNTVEQVFEAMKKRRIPLDKESLEAIEHRSPPSLVREPGPNDPLFFDPEADSPQAYPHEKFQRDWNELFDKTVRTGGMRPEIAYAAKKTGRVVTKENKKNLTRAELKEWDDAVKEYLDQISKGIH